MTTELGTLQRVDLRDVWQHEQYHFTPWLAEPANLEALGKTLGIELQLVGLEVAVGPYAADIVCTDTLTQTPVLIENQLAKTDHSHLGQILTYAAGLEAKTVVWVASSFTDEPLDDEARWPECHQWLSDVLGRMDAAFRPLIKTLQLADLPAGAPPQA